MQKEKPAGDRGLADDSAARIEKLLERWLVQEAFKLSDIEKTQCRSI